MLNFINDFGAFSPHTKYDLKRYIGPLRQPISVKHT